MINAETVRRGDAEIIENLLSEQVLDAAIEVHRTLGGPGLLVDKCYCQSMFFYLFLIAITIDSTRTIGSTLTIFAALTTLG